MYVSCKQVEEVWDQIGKRLREAREKAEMSVDDVVYRARIPRSVVEALEAEDFSVFTSPTYAKSFLRQYSEYLKVDAEPWLNALVPASYVSGESWQPMFAGGEPAPVPMKRQTRDPRRQEQEVPPGAGKWSAVWLMAMTAALVFGVVKGYQVFDEKFGKEESPKKEQVQEAKAPAKSRMPGISGESAGMPSDPGAPSVQVSQQEPPSNPPRAVIVRE
jgi:cytoskeletal protein RodZ